MHPVGTFLGINIGSSALTAAQIGESVAGNNIANANTPGYSVESVVLAENNPAVANDATVTTSRQGQIGTGVSALSITRASDQFLSAQVRNSNAEQGNQQSQSTWLTNIQTAFNEPGNTTINTQLQTFFANFATVQNNPEDSGVRESAIQGGSTLAQMFQTSQSQLDSASQQIGLAINNDVSSVNTYAQQIADLNKAILGLSAQGQAPNSLLDQRDSVLDKLSSLANISVRTNTDGTINVQVGSTALVSGLDSHAVTLSALQSKGDLTNGELYGLTQTQTNLTSYQGQLDTLAGQVITQVNQLHSQGTGLDGTTGLAFFTGTTARDIAVNPTLISNPNKLAAAGPITPATPPAVTPTTPPPGDASNAKALAALGSQTLGSSAGPLSGQTFSGYYNSLVTKLANDTASSKTNLTTAQATNTQLSNQLAQITGVSEDTEMTNMMKFQRMYEAAAKVISTQNTMLGDLISMVP